MTNRRNEYGVKDSYDTYLNINGKQYEQWTDFESKEDMERLNPNDKFISRKQKEGFTRIYRLVR